ncbi:carotenoid biosynthesis protein [Nocardia sp. NPDC052566]|uniref:carotenoid biosynthesis protein n=1 Tax=Nocardia sp. NPDC052566 TaxID=3364330 RepID=UPI0037CC9FDE
MAVRHAVDDDHLTAVGGWGLAAAARWWRGVGWGAGVFAVLLVLAQICYPLASGEARDRVTVVVVLLSAGTALAHARMVRGLRYATGFLVIVSGVGLMAEVVGTATGVPFGCYGYAEGRLGIAVAGVPLVVALAWTGGLYPVWVVAGMLVRRTSARIGLTAAGAVGWDLFLDPQMVADGQWTWCADSPGLPGIADIPYTNYLGWFAVALIMATLLAIWEHAAHAGPAAAAGTSTDAARRTLFASLRRNLPLRYELCPARPAHSASANVVPVTIFLWTWLGSALAHAVFLGLPYSACYGGIGLGVLGVPLLVRLIRERRGKSGGRTARRVAV